jgi:hypothetical protein
VGKNKRQRIKAKRASRVNTQLAPTLAQSQEVTNPSSVKPSSNLEAFLEASRINNVKNLESQVNDLRRSNIAVLSSLIDANAQIKALHDGSAFETARLRALKFDVLLQLNKITDLSYRMQLYTYWCQLTGNKDALSFEDYSSYMQELADVVAEELDIQDEELHASLDIL